MQKVQFKELYLISKKIKKARKLSFNDKTIITGGVNTTGKSSVLKSLYYSLGADVTFEDEWYPLEVSSLLIFSVNDTEYKSLRNGKQISIFNDKDEILISTTSITKELAPFISKMFEFYLPLVQNSDPTNPIQATPAFLFLPFYIDQDKSWSEYFSAFNGLGQFYKWKDSLKNFHSGIRPKEFYEAESQIKINSSALEKEKYVNTILTESKTKIEEKLGKSDFNIDITEYKEKLNILLNEFNEINNIEEELKQQLYLINEEEYNLETEIKQLNDLRHELDEDLEFLKSSKSIICPTCGVEHEKSLYKQYSIIEDIEDAVELITKLNKELIKIRSKKSEVEEGYDLHKNKSDLIREKMSVIEGKISLNQVLDSYAKKEASNTLNEQLEENISKQAKIVLTISEEKDNRDLYKNIKRSKKIKDEYIKWLEKYFNDLDIQFTDLKTYRARFTPPEKKTKTGSRAPRQMLALYYAYLKTMETYSSTYSFPFVIDSPKQQEQDDDNSKKIVDFCIENVPKKNQLILATLKCPQLSDDVKKIELTDKKGLLKEDYFSEYNDYFNSLYDKTLDYIANKKDNNSE